MVSSKEKGNQLEREVKKKLEGLGYAVFRQHRKPMFMKGRMITVGADIFGCDMVGLKVDAKPLFVQVTTIENKSKKIVELAKYPFPDQHVNVQIWCKVPREGYRVFSSPLWTE